MSNEQLAGLEVEWSGDVLVAALHGEIDRSNAAELGAGIEKSANAALALVLDVARLTYLDSSALTMVHTLALTGRPLHLVAPTGSRAARLLEIGGLDTVLAVHQTRADALTAASEVTTASDT